MRDGEPQTRPPKASCHRRIGLDELVEDPIQRRGRNSDSGVGDHDRERGFLGGGPELAHIDLHSTTLGELDRVAHEVGEDLPEAHRIPDEPARGLRWVVDDDLDVLADGRCVEQLRDLFHEHT